MVVTSEAPIGCTNKYIIDTLVSDARITYISSSEC